MKRIAIFSLSSRRGAAEDYVRYFLRAMSEFCEYLCVVVNGAISSDAEKALKDLSSALLINGDGGSDDMAYKYAIEHIGLGEISKYDELILCNSSFYGPVFPLHELFDRMESGNCDLWGISRAPESEQKDGSGKVHKIPSYIEPYFMAFRKKVTESPAFEEFWEKTSGAGDDDKDEKSSFAIRLTGFLENRGFSSGVYVSPEKYSGCKGDPSVFYAARQLAEDKNPFVKIGVFDYGTENWLCESIGHDARDTLDYIKNKTDYPYDLIWSDLIRNHKMSVLRSTLHLDFSLPADANVNKHGSGSRFAVILFVYYTDLVDECIGYLRNFPDYFDIFLISSNSGLLDIYKDRIKLPNKVSYTVCENRGRDVSAYLVGGIDVFRKYDIVCCLHDKKSKQLNSMKASDEYSYQCFHNLAASRKYIENIIGLFQTDRYLGMLVPPPVDFAMFACVGFEMEANLKISQQLYSELKLDVPFDDAPVAPYGTMFWCRGQAFSLLVDKKLTYEDFPPEPNGIDGTLLHAYERLYPMIVQNAGFYVGWVMTDDYCHTYLDNLYAKVWNFNRYFGKIGVYTWQNQLAFIRSKMADEKKHEPVECRIGGGESRIVLRGLKHVIFKYRIMSKITFGRTRAKYLKKIQAAIEIRKRILAADEEDN